MGDVRVRLGRTGLMVSPICYGAWQASLEDWGEQSKETLIEAMRAAFDSGINFFDTSDVYGFGRSEEILGEALATVPRDQVIVCTKVGRHFYADGRKHAELAGEYVARACEAQLRRLKMDYVDLYLMHTFDPLVDPEGLTAVLERLKRDGKIRHYGLSNWSVEQFRMARRFGDYDVTQTRYSLLDTGCEQDMWPFCQADDIGVMGYSALCKGILGGKYTGDETFEDHRRHNSRLQGETFRKLCENVRGLGETAEHYGLSIAQLALAATLMHPAVHSAIVGVKRAEQIVEAAGAMGKVLSVADYHAIRSTVSR